MPKVTLLQGAEHGAHFLRNYYPDVDISGELIRESITEDENFSRDSGRNGVYAGSTVDVTSFQVARKDHAYLAFPMGERCCELNMSPLVANSKTKIELKPVSTPVHTFDTPIQQILASPHTNDVGKGKMGPVLGVRTMGPVSFMQVKIERTSHTIELSPLITVQRSDVGDRLAVDMSMYPSHTAVGYVANEAGDIYRCLASESKAVIEPIHIANASSMLLCRIAAHGTREKVVASFDATATVLDLRAGKKPYELFSVTKPGVRLTSVEPPSEDHTLRLVSTDEIIWLDERFTRKPLLAVRHSRDFDLTLRTRTHILTNGIFMEQKEKSLVAQSNSVNDVLERMPRFWQDPGAPVEHSLTTFDIALRMGNEPPEASRNDWATGSSLDCAAGYRSLEKGQIPRERLVRGAPWHLDASPSLRRHVPEFDAEPKKTIENLARYNLADDPRRPADSYRMETEARSQLALDLALAADIFSMNRPRGEAPTTLEDDMLSISLSTQAMTLGDMEPPPVHFGFLRPIRKAVQSNGAKDVDSEIGYGDKGTSKLNTPRGVRLLLQEWDLGSNSHEYVYCDPYDESIPIPAAASKRPARVPTTEEPPGPVKGPTQITTQRPPPVASSIPHAPPVIAASQPTLPTRRPLVAARSEGDLVLPLPTPPINGSQPTDVWAAPPSSQDVPFASTQVLPGPHGGRAPLAAKKKKRDKRVSGF
ncbi:hypothetical protein GSI_13967 [Ganoderma sinense ZZ0214-1]|uniref:Uncharacterized protein n=1 Tax=Ganoderma sinense ZZ0214-1 TaxID=1077348 RepID=A0A2G8RRS3_9APHY|nr:hypothetical protein GSI_13967 [Ganoderma sinense ZZ0214-1]